MERRLAAILAADVVGHRSGVPTDRRGMGRPSPTGRSRLTFDRSPVR